MYSTQYSRRMCKHIHLSYLMSSFGSASSSSCFFLLDAGVEFGVLAAEDFGEKDNENNLLNCDSSLFLYKEWKLQSLLTVFPSDDGVTSMALRFAAALYSNKATVEFTFLRNSYLKYAWFSTNYTQNCTWKKVWIQVVAHQARVFLRYQTLSLLVSLHTPGWREALWEYRVLPKNSTQCPQPGLQTGPLDLETSALTMIPPRIPQQLYIGQRKSNNNVQICSRAKLK